MDKEIQISLSIKSISPITFICLFKEKAMIERMHVHSQAAMEWAVRKGVSFELKDSNEPNCRGLPSDFDRLKIKIEAVFKGCIEVLHFTIGAFAVAGMQIYAFSVKILWGEESPGKAEELANSTRMLREMALAVKGLLIMGFGNIQYPRTLFSLHAEEVQQYEEHLCEEGLNEKAMVYFEEPSKKMLGVELLKKVAERDKNAQRVLGNYFLECADISPDEPFFAQYAEKGDDFEMSLLYFSRAADQNDLSSQRKAVEMCQRLIDLFEDDSSADQRNRYEMQAFHYSKMVCENRLNPRPTISEILRLAEMYERGIGTEVNLREALKWYKKAADKGDQRACIRVVSILSSLDGSKEEIEKYTRASTVIWIEEKAKAGHIPELMELMKNKIDEGDREGAIEFANSIFLNRAEAKDFKGMLKLYRSGYVQFDENLVKQIDTLHSEGTCPLVHSAALQGHHELVFILVEGGVNFNYTLPKGETLFDCLPGRISFSSYKASTLRKKLTTNVEKRKIALKKLAAGGRMPGIPTQGDLYFASVNRDHFAISSQDDFIDTAPNVKILESFTGWIKAIDKLIPDRINDEGMMRSKREFIDRIKRSLGAFESDYAVRDAYGAYFNPEAHLRIHKILKHLVFTLREEEGRAESSSDGVKLFHQKLKRIIVDDIGIKLFHCTSGFITMIEDLYYFDVKMAVPKGIDQKTQDYLQLKRRALFQEVVANSIEYDSHPANTHSYYRQKYAATWGLGTAIVDDTYGGAITYGYDEAINRGMSRELTFSKIVEWLWNAIEDGTLSSEHLFQWVQDFYPEIPSSKLIDASGKWRKEVLVLFLEHLGAVSYNCQS